MNINLKNSKITIFIFSLLSIILLGMVSYLYIWKYKQAGILIQEQKELSVENRQPSHQPCLSNNEIADFDYMAYLYESTGVKLPSSATTTIFIKDKNTNEELFKFTIGNVRTNSPSLEIHKCGVYVIRNFDRDKKEGFYKKRELWHYVYNGNNKVLMNNEEFYPYSTPIRVDLSETYIALNKLYLGHPEHSVVIKNLKTTKLDDVLVIKPADIWENLPQLNKERNIGLVGWSNNSKYVWGSSQSQMDTVYFRVDISKRDKLNIEVFPMPEDAIHYGPPRLNTGYIWYIDSPPLGWNSWDGRGNL